MVSWASSPSAALPDAPSRGVEGWFGHPGPQKWVCQAPAPQRNAGTTVPLSSPAPPVGGAPLPESRRSLGWHSRTGEQGNTAGGVSPSVACARSEGGRGGRGGGWFMSIPNQALEGAPGEGVGAGDGYRAWDHKEGGGEGWSWAHPGAAPVKQPQRIGG